jgi:hypothetical protein
MRPSVPDVHITDSRDAELAEYRPLAGQAVLALIFGLLAPLAMIDVMLWAIPALGVILGWWALRRIKKNAPGMTGRKMALTGLALSLMFLVAAPGDWLAYRSMIRDEAQQFSALWFKYLNQEEPQKAHQLTMTPQARQTLDDRLWAYYRNNPKAHQDLENYAKLPLVRTLLALGPKAQVRFYQTAGQVRDNDNDQVEQLYAVTYEEDNERKTFFVLVRMARRKLTSGGAGWRILQTEGGVRPEGWPDGAAGPEKRP